MVETEPPPASQEPALTTQNTSSVFRVCLFLHRWTGLLSLPVFLVMVITGSVLIFSEEINQLLGDVPAGTHQQDKEVPARKSIAELTQTAVAQHPGKRLLYLYYEKDRLDRATVRVGDLGFQKEDDGTDVIMDSVSGKSMSTIVPDETFVGWILKLHKEWFLGRPGELVSGFVALLVLISLVSGLFIYAPYAKKAFLGVIRWKSSTRLTQLDLHTVIGVIVLGWALVVTFTGIFLAVAGVTYDNWKMTALQPVLARISADGGEINYQNPPISPDQAVATVQARFPDWRFDWIVWPLTDYSTPRHYAIWMAGPPGPKEHLFETAYVDAVTGELTDTIGFPWYMKVMLLSEPLHFGDYGGMPLKILWVTSAWLTLFITANGAWLWWDRRRRRSANSAPAGKTLMNQGGAA